MRSSLVKVPVLSKQHTSTLPANGILKGSVQYTPAEKQIIKELISYERLGSLKSSNIQGCALAEPPGPWRLTFVLGQLENLCFFLEIIRWHTGFHKIRALGSLQFFLEHSIDIK